MNILTDQYFTYRESASSVDGVAKLELKGNSIGWNQLVQNGNFADTSIWQNYGSTFTVSGNTATVKATNASTQFGIFQAITVKANHKYFISFEAKKHGTITLKRNRFSSGQEQVQEGLYRTIETASADSTLSSPIRILFAEPVSDITNDYFMVKNYMIIDLTLLNDSRVSDYNTFRQYYPLEYYSYNQGELINFNGNAIKTVGKNQLDSQEAVSGNYATLTKGTGTIREVYTNGTAIYIDISFFQTSPYANGHFLPKKYTLSFDIEGIPSGQRWTVGLRNTSNAFIQSIVISADGHYSKVLDFENVVDCYLSFCRTTGTSAFDITVSNLQLELGESETSYEDYKETTTDLPISTYFPSGMKSAGSVYDELNSKAITRVGSVDLGSLAWTYNLENGHNNFYTMDIDTYAQRPSSNDAVANIMCSKYQTVARNVLYNGQVLNSICIAQTNGRLWINDDSYTDASTFKSAMSGVYLNYELSSYTEVDVSPIYYDAYKGGTEQLLPTNGASPTTSPLWADITYYTSFEGEIPYRKFWLINSNGDKWTFTERDFRVFLNNPQGLGFTKTISTNRYGNAQTITDISDNFPQISGDVLFYDSYNQTRYDRYNQFVKFISYEPLKLYYHLPVSYYSRIPNIYYIDCVVGSLNKTESKNDNLLTCPIQFNCLSFYKGEDVNISGSGLSYTINNDSDFPIGFEITIEGSPVNPYVLLEQDGELYGEAKFDDSTAFDSVYVNSNDGEQNVILEQGGSILPNPLSYQDLSISNGSIYVTFVKLARGTSELTIGMDSGSVTSVNIKYVPLYRSV